MIIYLEIFVISLLLSIILTILVKKIATKLKILDHPGGDRKIHKKPTPLLGGIAVFLSFFLTIVMK
jgi:UDP-GlcNAc:undecaprenyl-phosphate GlcNAc-1-phosphate transferase